eukprot:1139540-Pelagomonas_calceolata.AAC.1
MSEGTDNEQHQQEHVFEEASKPAAPAQPMLEDDGCQMSESTDNEQHQQEHVFVEASEPAAPAQPLQPEDAGTEPQPQSGGGGGGGGGGFDDDDDDGFGDFEESTACPEPEQPPLQQTPPPQPQPPAPPQAEPTHASGPGDKISQAAEQDFDTAVSAAWSRIRAATQASTLAAVPEVLKLDNLESSAAHHHQQQQQLLQAFDGGKADHESVRAFGGIPLPTHVPLLPSFGEAYEPLVNDVICLCTYARQASSFSIMIIASVLLTAARLQGDKKTKGRFSGRSQANAQATFCAPVSIVNNYSSDGRFE